MGVCRCHRVSGSSRRVDLGFPPTDRVRITYGLGAIRRWPFGGLLGRLHLSGGAEPANESALGMGDRIGRPRWFRGVSARRTPVGRIVLRVIAACAHHETNASPRVGESRLRECFRMHPDVREAAAGPWLPPAHVVHDGRIVGAGAERRSSRARNPATADNAVNARRRALRTPDQRAQREGARGAAFECRAVTVTTSPSTELGRGRRPPRRNHPRPDRCYGMIFSTSPTVGAVLKLAT